MRRGGMGGLSRGYAGLVSAAAVGRAGNTVSDQFSASITISTPAAYHFLQRESGVADIAITGTHSGILSGGIEARFNGGAWQTIVATPSGSDFSGTLTDQATGQGAVEVRCVNAPSSADSVTPISIGDIYVVIGDSNHFGYADAAVQPNAANGWVSTVYGNDGVWKEHTEAVTYSGAFADPTGSVYGTGTTSAKGSYFGALATLIMDNAGVPVGFIPQGIGSSTVEDWQPGGAGGGGPAGFNENFPLDVMGIRCRDAGGGTGTDIVPHKAVLCTLGTNGGGTDQADYETKLNALVEGWVTYHGGQVVLCLPASPGNAWVTAATQAVIDDNANALQGPDFEGAWSGVHYTTSGEVQDAADLMWAALEVLFY